MNSTQSLYQERLSFFSGGKPYQNFLIKESISRQKALGNKNQRHAAYEKTLLISFLREKLFLLSKRKVSTSFVRLFAASCGCSGEEGWIFFFLPPPSPFYGFSPFSLFWCLPSLSSIAATLVVLLHASTIVELRHHPEPLLSIVFSTRDLYPTSPLPSKPGIFIFTTPALQRATPPPSLSSPFFIAGFCDSTRCLHATNAPPHASASSFPSKLDMLVLATHVHQRATLPRRSASLLSIVGLCAST